MIGEPKVEVRAEQPYVAIPIKTTLREWGRANALVGEVFVARLAELLATFHGNVQRRWQDDHGTLGEVERRVELGTRLRPHVHEGRLTSV
jgi:hypothetical protein